MHVASNESLDSALAEVASFFTLLSGHGIDNDEKIVGKNKRETYDISLSWIDLQQLRA